MQTLTFVPALLPAALIAPAGAHRARGSAVDVTGKVSNSGARPPETGFTLCCVRGGKIRVIVARLFHFLPFFLSCNRYVPHAASGLHYAQH